MIDLNTILSELNEDDGQPTPPAICYYPGGFKPPHEGHFEVVKDLASRTYITKVIVLIGHKTRDGITKEQSKRIWDLYLAASPMAKVSVRISTDASPIKDIFTAFDDDLELKAYVAGAKNEVEEQDYFTPLQKAFGDRVMPLAIEEKVITGNKRLSATQVRGLITQIKQSVLKLRSIPDKNSTEYSKARNEYLNTYKTLEGCFPEVVIQKGQFDDILKILGIPVLSISALKEVDPNTYRVPKTSAPISDDDDVTKGQDTVIKVPYHKTPGLENFLNTNLIPFEYSQYNFNGNERRIVIPNLGDDEDGQKARAQVVNYLDKKGIPHDLEEDLFTIKWWKKSLTEFKLDVKPTVNIKNVDKEELKKGIKVEKEHTTDIKTAMRIALDHLSEDPKYYSKLAKAGLEETIIGTGSGDVVNDFIDFAVKALELSNIPEIEFTDDEELARNMHSLGAYNPETGKLLVVKGPRLTADILRTLGHELVHRKQDEIEKLGQGDGATGSPIENEANAAAGILLRKFGEYRPEIFEQLQEADRSKGDYKIYCDMDGVLVDFEKGYKDLTGRDASYKTNPEEFWEPITKAGAPFWIKLQWMPDGKELWNYIKQYNPELLSAPSREESSKMGKRIWVKRNIPGTKLLLKSAERKQEYATPNAILIDDRADNIQRWKDAGGVGIHHTSAANTIEQLKKLGL
jgi:phosphopantetheine adenylyltransferase